MTNRLVRVVICVWALSVLGVPSKALALPILITIQSTHVSFGHGSYDNAIIGGPGSHGFANVMGLIPWAAGMGSFGGGGGAGGGAFGAPGGGASGRGGSQGANALAFGPELAGGFPGGGGGFPGRGVGLNVAFAVISLWSLGHPSDWFDHVSSSRSSSASVNATASTAPDARVPEPASALLFATGAFLVLRSATRRQRT